MELAGADVTVAAHPLGVRPMGSLLLAAPGTVNLRDVPGALGRLGPLSDELLLRVLAAADACTLACCAGVSRALRMYSHSDDLWRVLVLEQLPKGAQLIYSVSWRHTYIAMVKQSATAAKPANGATAAAVDPAPAPPLPALYSDALFTPWFCGTASIPERWLVTDNIPRVDGSTLGAAEFEARFEAPGLPVVLTNLTSAWSACGGCGASSRWDEDALRSRFGDRLFNVGGHRMALGDFFDYASSTTDEVAPRRPCRRPSAPPRSAGRTAHTIRRVEPPR